MELQELKPPSDHRSSSNTVSSNEKFVRRSTRKRKRPDWLALNSDPVETPAIKNKKLIRKSPNGSPIKLFCRKEDLALMTCVNHLGPKWNEIKERMSSFGFERNSKSSFSDRWNRLQEKIYIRFCYKPFNGSASEFQTVQNPLKNLEKGRYTLAWNFINDYNAQFNQPGMTNGNQYDSNNNLIVQSDQNGYYSRF